MRKPAKRRGPTDGEIYRRALAIGLVGVAGAALVSGLTAGPAARAAAFFRRFVAPQAAASALLAEQTPASAHLFPEPLSEEQRKKGFHECYPHDPAGLGPYAPYKNLTVGRIAVPQSGGHTPDMGFDVLIQFHGHDPVRKTLVQVARGMVYVGIDRGLGSGAYSDAFGNPDVFRALHRSIEGALRRHTGDTRAHIRHLTLSAWSAGYGAVNEILKYDASRVDAVVLLDGLHAAWNPSAKTRDSGVSSLSSQTVAPTFRFAKEAALGNKLFVLTHSEVVPETYPSSRQTADLLLHELGLRRTPLDPGSERFGQTATVDSGGLHVWSFRGTNELAHCSHIPHIARALHLLEDAWATPAMDRSVPPTPAPVLGSPDAGIVLEALEDDGGAGAAVAAAVGADPIAAALAAPAPELELVPRPGAASPAPAAEPPPEPAAPTAPAPERPTEGE